jgi:hypothetical protein
MLIKQEIKRMFSWLNNSGVSLIVTLGRIALVPVLHLYNGDNN